MGENNRTRYLLIDANATPVVNSSSRVIELLIQLGDRKDSLTRLIL